MLKFQQFSSKFDPQFWRDLADFKINKAGLDDLPVAIRAFYGPSFGFPLAFLAFTGDSFGDSLGISPVIYGNLYNSNTIEEYHSLNKKQIFDEIIQNVSLFLHSVA